MPTPRVTMFNAFDFTEEELKEAAILSPLTIMWLNTLGANTLEEKALLKLDPEKPLDFIQQEAYLKGQLEAINTILSAATLS